MSGGGFVHLFVLTLLWILLSNASSLSIKSATEQNSGESRVGKFPPSCTRIECPSYDVIHSGKGFEIRRYDSPVWMSTSPIDDISLVEATRTGFLRLFDYIQGKNEYQKQIEMTAPVITEVKPSDGPFCASSFIVSFYVPKVNQANTPPAKGLHVQRWEKTYVAVRQFSGFVADSDVAVEASALHDSVSGTKWADAIDKSHAGENTTIYTVAQYNSPFEFQDRVNEIWLTFQWNEDQTVRI
ncbi:OLC1v1023393C1 [Oldenlandia corymbosa var. corymbosa]|uniref:OLC1v1023393C1 n=1 Tax=Oldenlandia corymbosa var. corymbosa TaxID=529605 RepID=A0AAV1C2T4_OLDCO|nr:OLC1v1023393C1 [Oldenlandia corymbosa var. corymbosa]